MMGNPHHGNMVGILCYTIGMRCFVAINEPTRKRFDDALSQARSFLPARAIVHVDISDGVWTPVVAVVSFWGIKKYGGRMTFAAHLMLPWKKIISPQWYGGAFRMLYIHAREVRDWQLVQARAQKHGVRIGAVVTADDSAEVVKRIPFWVRSFLILAVVPGKSGQKFNRAALRVIKFLKKNHSRATIVVDGGINKKTAIWCKKAGADGVVSASYIWSAPDPRKAYRTLKEI
jgi:ribulose-phosphate 3-epimerase